MSTPKPTRIQTGAYHRSTPYALLGWDVRLSVNGDGELNVHIQHADGSKVYSTGADLGQRHIWSENFTTERIEAGERYNLPTAPASTAIEL